MALSSTLNVTAPAKRYQLNWIVSKRADLLWFIGGALGGYFLFYLHSGLHLDMLTVWFFWVVFIDTPHFFGTYSRTYFDKEEFRHRKKLYLGSLGWLLVGPTMIFISYLLFKANVMSYRIPFIIFIVFFNLWAYWHVVRQHYGIMSLYKRKNGDFSFFDRRLDQAILYVGLIAPFVSFVFRHPDARTILGLHGLVPALPSTTFFGLFGWSYWSQLTWEQDILVLSIIAVSSVSLVFLFRQVQLLSQNKPINLPKLIFLMALLPLYMYICYSPAALTAPLIAFSAFVTVYHDIQYLAIVWFYNKNKYHGDGASKEKYGLAVKISKNFFTFILCGVSMAAIFRLFGCSMQIHPGCGVLVMTSKYVLFPTFTTKELLTGFLLGFSLHHYFVDQFIWRPSKDKQLRKDLHLKNA